MLNINNLLNNYLFKFYKTRFIFLIFPCKDEKFYRKLIDFIDMMC